MTIFTLTLLVSAFSVVSTQGFGPPSSQHEIIRYCEESRFDNRFPPTPVECCDERARCNKIILPMETKYNLTNPDPIWSRRQCICDIKLYECVTKNLDEASLKRTTIGFTRMICFREIIVRVKDNIRTPVYQFIPLLTAISRLIPVTGKPSQTRKS